MSPVNRVLGAVQSLRFSPPVIDTLYAELQLAAPSPSNNNIPATYFREALGQVNYTYYGVPQPSVNDLSLAIHRGESVGFICASGAGKSTMLQLIVGLICMQWLYQKDRG